MEEKFKLNQLPQAELEAEQINDFCIPDRCCPNRFPSPKFPSPTGCLPQEDLERVEEEIRAANELLLDLALAENRSPEETFQKVFDGLVGLQAEVKTQTNKIVEGQVTIVGFNFVVLKEKKLETIVPLEEITIVKPCGRLAEPQHESQLRAIDPCFRRDLTFHFGEVVASSPELIQLFFKMRLAIYLLLLEAKRICVHVEDKAVEGLLTNVDKEAITLKVKEAYKIIPINKISLVTINL